MAKVRPLNNALKEIATKELNEVESRIPTDIATLKQWIAKQPHLKVRTDDQYLLAFLRGSKHSMEKAKSKIEHFYTIKTMVPELFGNRRINEKYEDFARRGICIWTPKPLNSDWPNISFTRFQNFDTNKFTLLDIFRYRLFSLEHYLKNDDNCIVSGFIDIFDLEHFPFSLYAQIDVPIIRKLAVFGKKALPVRYKSIHVLNLKSEYREIFHFIKSLLVEKYLTMIFVHKTLDELHEHVPKEYLPKEYGGTNSTLDEITKQNFQQMLALNDFLIEDENFGVNEQLRPNKQSMNKESLFGFDGSFRKLDFD